MERRKKWNENCSATQIEQKNDNRDDDDDDDDGDKNNVGFHFGKKKIETKRNLPAQHLYFAHFCTFPAHTLCLFGEHLIIYVLHFTFALTSFINFFECTYTLHSHTHTHVHIHTEWTELWKGYLKEKRKKRDEKSNSRCCHLLPYSQHKRQPKQATFRVLHHYGLPGRTKNNQREFKRKEKMCNNSLTYLEAKDKKSLRSILFGSFFFAFEFYKFIRDARHV